jgi:zinc transporter ZupT
VESGVLKSLTFAFAMSFHSILEGFALGVQVSHFLCETVTFIVFQESSAGIMTLFVSLIIHKGIEAFSVGLQVSRANSKRMLIVILTIIVYALMTPVGFSIK